LAAALSRADGSTHFRATKDGKGICLIEAGTKRYEIVDSFVSGGRLHMRHALRGQGGEVAVAKYPRIECGFRISFTAGRP
jgi:hypothetical protein